MIDKSERIVEDSGRMMDNPERMVENSGRMVDNSGRMVETAFAKSDTVSVHIGTVRNDTGPPSVQCRTTQMPWCRTVLY
jgi:hypothetical protein